MANGSYAYYFGRDKYLCHLQVCLYLYDQWHSILGYYNTWLITVANSQPTAEQLFNLDCELLFFFNLRKQRIWFWFQIFLTMSVQIGLFLVPVSKVIFFDSKKLIMTFCAQDSIGVWNSKWFSCKFSVWSISKSKISLLSKYFNETMKKICYCSFCQPIYLFNFGRFRMYYFQ